MKVEFSGTIRVASRIIDYLSSGLYRSPAACLKELINNSFDADAGRVEVFVKPDADRIIIRDDGIGMSRGEFEAHFNRISESHKRDASQVTPSGRPKIGKIGIGFIAANELCESMELFSTKRGSNELLHITINFDEMRKPPEQRRFGESDFVKADYVGEVLDADPEEHFTEIFLERVRGEAREILAGAKPQTQNARPQSLYGLSADSICKRLTHGKLSTWKEFDAYSETMLKIGLNVPVSYCNDWLPPKLRRRVIGLEQDTAKLNFRVFYDGSELRKPIVFPSEERAFVTRFSYSGKHVSAKGYFYAQHGAIKPVELHGLLVRIRHAAIGEYDGSFWGFSQSESSLIQTWVSSEIWADDRLEDAMNIDRSTLRETHPAYVELRKALHESSRKVFSEARSRIYEASNKERTAQRAARSTTEIRTITRERVRGVSPAAARVVEQSLPATGQTAAVQKKLSKKYSIVEVYRLVVDVASEILPPRELDKFLRKFAERLWK